LTEDFNHDMMDPAAAVWLRPNRASFVSRILMSNFFAMRILPG
jgi:hypothetical protein